jgi:hypothetical protein
MASCSETITKRAIRKKEKFEGVFLFSPFKKRKIMVKEE